MFKTKLHEYCHSKAWLLPEFGVEREGPDHCARFKGVVVVNGNSFTSPDFSRSIKEAHNLAAKLAYEHFIGCSNLGMTANSAPASRTVQLPEIQEASSTSSSTGVNRVEKDNNMPKDKGNMYKNQLQVYAQKRKLEFPVYSTERKGPIHQSLFKSKVTVEGKTYESEEFFHTLRNAEAAAAKVALAKIIPEGTEEDDPSIYKNLLQEYLRKGIPCIPKYTTVQAGPPHMPIFFPTVEIRGETFKGEPAITKKQAELSVAKVAFIALRERGLKQGGKLNVVGPTTQVMKTPQSSPAKIPNVLGPTTQVMKTPQTSPAKISDAGTFNLSKIVTSDAQFMSGKQTDCVEDKGIEAIPNHFTRIPGSTTSSVSIENPEATSCPYSPPFYPTSPAKKKKKQIIVLPQSRSPDYTKPGTNNLEELNTPRGPILVACTNKMGSVVSPDLSVRILHSEEKWTAITGKSD